MSKINVKKITREKSGAFSLVPRKALPQRVEELRPKVGDAGEEIIQQNTKYFAYPIWTVLMEKIVVYVKRKENILLNSARRKL